MPFKSEAQHKKFRVLLAQKKITQEQFNEWMKSTKSHAKDKKHPIVSLPKQVKVAALKEVAAIAVRQNGKMLVGKRKDNGKLTNPGGHLEKGEAPIDGAVRELKEETGIEAKKKDLKFLKTIETDEFRVHGFLYRPKGSISSSMKGDPDDEVYRWHMRDMKKIKDEDLHVPRENNVLLTKEESNKVAGMTFSPEEEAEFFKGFFKNAGGPGSGVTGDNTRVIDELEESPIISIGYRKKFMEDHKPTLENTTVKVSLIKFKGQEKCVPKKLKGMIESAKKDKSLFEKPVKLLRDEDGNYHVIDGHHRVLAAIALGVEDIKADVYVLNHGTQKVAQRMKHIFTGVKKKLKEEYDNPNMLQLWGMRNPNVDADIALALVDENKEPSPPGF
jgi:8-oxo-dGTP pyrophosphatase MutT (NUDIX family)